MPQIPAESNDASLAAACFQLFGESAANAGGILALIETHPNPDALLVALERTLEQMYAVLLGMAQTEVGLAHFEAQANRLKDACRSAIEARRPRR